MVINGLKQPPFNNTLMGAMRGVLDLPNVPASDAFLYGVTGQAFLMNIHRQLCPSGPYCWNQTPFFGLAANLGIRIADLGFYHFGSPQDVRAGVEGEMRESLDNGFPCMLLNMEWQLIAGYDETGFITAQPWPGLDFPPAHLTFGTWQELGEDIHINFYALEWAEPAPPQRAVRDALAYAVDLWRHPKDHTSEDYGVGPDAYANWIAAIEAGHGDSHGNWWNGTVWAECRARAAEFLSEVAPMLPSPDTVREIGREYGMVAEIVGRCSDKELDPTRKAELLGEACARERACIQRIEAML